MPSSRVEALLGMPPHLLADLTLYAASEGGRASAISRGWGCPCLVSKASPLIGWDGWPLLEESLAPGSRRVGFVFLSGDEAAEKMRNAGVFYLWEGRFIGEAFVVSDGAAT